MSDTAAVLKDIAERYDALEADTKAKLSK